MMLITVFIQLKVNEISSYFVFIMLIIGIHKKRQIVFKHKFLCPKRTGGGIYCCCQMFCFYYTSQKTPKFIWRKGMFKKNWGENTVKLFE